MKLIILLMMLLLSFSAFAEYHRSQKAKNIFKQYHPCPATGKSKGSCPGWIIDHRIGLCVGGLDSHENMRWMTVSEAKNKDRWECKPGWESKLEQCEVNNCFFK